MCDLSKLLLICCGLLFSVVTCKNDSYRGILSPECVAHYYRLYVTMSVPPRDYLYYHETLTGETDLRNPVEIQFRIIGGSQVPITDVPYQVLYGLYCGGTLIAPNWVLTAAHCKERESFVLAGSSHRSVAAKYDICAHFTHPLWNMTKLHSHDYDYQLVMLETPVPVTASSRPIAIGSLGDIQSGAMVTVSGWGHTKYKEHGMQDLVRKVRVPVISREVCQSLPLENYRRITARMFCAGYLNGTKDSCQGDSGGPAVINGKLVGLVSFGVGCAMKDQPGVYSNIPLVRVWIRSVTKLPL